MTSFLYRFEAGVQAAYLDLIPPFSKLLQARPDVLVPIPIHRSSRLPAFLFERRPIWLGSWWFFRGLSFFRIPRFCVVLSSYLLFKFPRLTVNGCGFDTAPPLVTTCPPPGSVVSQGCPPGFSCIYLIRDLPLLTFEFLLPNHQNPRSVYGDAASDSFSLVSWSSVSRPDRGTNSFSDNELEFP